MHAVIRKRQGIPYTPAQPKGLVTNGQHFVSVAVRSEPFPTDELAIAYSVRAYPKLVGQATSTDDDLRLKALARLCKMLQSVRELSSLVPAGIVKALTQTAELPHCTHSRILATEAMLPLARDYNGRSAMLEDDSDMVPTLLRLMRDAEPAVRANALAVHLQLARFPVGARALLAGGCVQLLVGRCTEEKSSEQLAAVLAALAMVTETDAAALKQAISSGAIETVCALVDGKYLLDQPAPAVCQHGFSLLRTLTIGTPEKQLAVSQGVLRPLIDMLSPAVIYTDADADEEVLHCVATQAAGALMSLTAHTECKGEAVRLGAIPPLLVIMQGSVNADRQQQLTYAASMLTNYASKCISNLSEDPSGRKQLQKALPNIALLSVAPEPLVSKHAELAKYQVQWQP